MNRITGRCVDNARCDELVQQVELAGGELKSSLTPAVRPRKIEQPHLDLQILPLFRKFPSTT